MIFELLPQIGILVFLMAFIGHVITEAYYLGYYRGYPPNILDNSIDKFLRYCSISFVLMLFLLSIVSNIILNIGGFIPTEAPGVYVVVLYYLILWILYIIGLSFLTGYIMPSFMNGVILIKTGNEEQEKTVKTIHGESHEFLYYLDLYGHWGAIRKQYIISMESINRPSLFQSWLKKVLNKESQKKVR